MLPNAQPRPRPRYLTRMDRQRAQDRIDRDERAKCKARSGGRCEVIVNVTPGGRIVCSCRQRAVENHHLISGIGRRNQGRSILAAHRLDVCKVCHAEITNHVLVPVDGTKKHDAATVRYERVR